MIEAKIDPDKKIMFFLFFVFIIVVIGYTYSYFSSKDESDNQSISTGNLSIKYTENDEGIINANNIYPILDENIKDKATKLNFTVSNNGNIDSKYSIKLTDITIDNELINDDFKWALYSGENLIVSDDFLNITSDSDYVLLKNETLKSTLDKNYTLYIWISETNEEQNEMKDKNFKSKIIIEAVQNS